MFWGTVQLKSSETCCYLHEFLFSTAPPTKTVIKERRPSSGGVKPVQQVFYTEWKNETG